MMWNQKEHASKLILASASPRRGDILKQIGLQFITQASDLDEEEQFGQPMPPTDLVKSLALKKARKVAGSINEGLVIGADTIVVIEGEILGKPSSSVEAITMLTRLNGKEHSVFTGVALVEVPSERSVVSFS